MCTPVQKTKSYATIASRALWCHRHNETNQNFFKVNYNDIRSNVMSQSETNQNKRPIGHIAHMSNKNHDKIMEPFVAENKPGSCWRKNHEEKVEGILYISHIITYHKASPVLESPRKTHEGQTKEFRRDLEVDIKRMDKNWKEVERIAQDRGDWRILSVAYAHAGLADISKLWSNIQII